MEITFFCITTYNQIKCKDLCRQQNDVTLPHFYNTTWFYGFKQRRLKATCGLTYKCFRFTFGTRRLDPYCPTVLRYLLRNISRGRETWPPCFLCSGALVGSSDQRTYAGQLNYKHHWIEQSSTSLHLVHGRISITRTDNVMKIIFICLFEKVCKFLLLTVLHDEYVLRRATWLRFKIQVWPPEGPGRVSAVGVVVAIAVEAGALGSRKWP